MVVTQVSRPAVSPRAWILGGALHGARTWLVYGLMEVLLVAVLPWFALPPDQYYAYDASFSAYMIVLYALIGALLGAAAGGTLHALGARDEDPGALLQAAAATTLTLALAWNVLTHPDIAGMRLVLSVGLAVLLLAAAVRRRGLAGFANPWVVCGLLIFPFWLADTLEGVQAARRNARLIIFALTLAAVPAIAYAISRRFRGFTQPGLYPLRQLAIAAIAAAGITAASGALAPGIRTRPIGSAKAAQGPNVILIVLDTVRADHLSLYGYERNTTPNLNKLASVSTVFERALSSGDMTLSSHASLFTGLYASRHKAHLSANNPIGAALSSNFPTLARTLAEAGYHTMGLAANTAFFSKAFGLDQGFAEFSSHPPRFLMAQINPYFLRTRALLLGPLVRLVGGSDLQRVTLTAGQVNAEALQILSRRPRNRPFFLFLNYMDAHEPYLPPAPYDTLFPGKDPDWTRARYKSAEHYALLESKPLTGKDREHLLSQYDGGIAYLDSQLGALFDTLRKQDLFDNTLLVVTADHGEALGERNLLGHGLSVHQNQIAVPLLIKLPGSRQAAVVQRPVSLVDVFPTVAAALKLAAPRQIDGQNLLEPPAAPEHVFAESFPGGSLAAKTESRAIVTGALKLISASNGRKELYNLESDPAETRNLYPGDKSIGEELTVQLARWVRAAAQGARSTPAPINKADMERLKSLGYVQ
jgi:arylsulfatase A-like enzyme